ncbi:hypothetical protein PT285_04685 [Lactobacillus sp. ESL0791]|uniref:hypothetical protein n=1 Tax=Lactobacillus sp. ESL0791 TaxID=2983234 RepID=UPI0023F68AFB|nr:hypothetical protein [Lactobacillus sp. ESL0791]MDF7638694.1 hypothetical protein [Lactobacillus sp. ESL0791]
MKEKDNNSTTPSNNNKKVDNSKALPWYKKTWGKAVIILVLISTLSSKVLGTGLSLLFIGTIIMIGSIVYFLDSLVNKNKLRNSIIILILGAIIISFGGNMMSNDPNNNAQTAHSSKVQKAKFKKKTEYKTKPKENKKSNKSKKHKIFKKAAVGLTAAHAVAKTKNRHHKQQETTNIDSENSKSSDDKNSNSTNNSNQQVASNQNKQRGNTKAYAPQEGYVFVAPDHGKRYHYNPDCRGLSNADNIVKMTLAEAKSQGYTECQIDGDNPN